MDGKAAENGKKRDTLTRVKKCAVGIFGAVAVLYCAVLAFAAVFADRIIFPAPIASYTESMEDLRFVPLSGGGKMAAVFLPSAKSDICVIYSHGNGEDLGRIKGVLSGYNTRGFNVLAYDYRGYGLTGGTASQRALEECADAADEKRGERVKDYRSEAYHDVVHVKMSAGYGYAEGAEGYVESHEHCGRAEPHGFFSQIRCFHWLLPLVFDAGILYNIF